MKELGQRIKRQRLKKGYTLQDTADLAGYSKSLISKIENGKVTPPISTLVKIATVLDSTVTELLEEPNAGKDIITFDVEELKKNLIPTERGYSYSPIAHNFYSKKLQPFYYEVRKDDFFEKILQHEGEEFVYILEGEAECFIGNHIYNVKAGEGLYFRSAEPHKISPKTAIIKYFDIFTYEENN